LNVNVPGSSAGLNKTGLTDELVASSVNESGFFCSSTDVFSEDELQAIKTPARQAIRNDCIKKVWKPNVRKKIAFTAQVKAICYRTRPMVI
jgi:hypothetical protein